MKHHTSKLATFEDLTEVETFGFRGEALFSLCALSERVTITTATAGEAPKGTILEFDRTGRLISKSSKVARQVSVILFCKGVLTRVKKGTTVCVEGIFSPLPVRHKEFKKNAKRELAKCLNLLNAYALVPCSKENRGVRLSVVNILDKGWVTFPFFSSQGSIFNTLLDGSPINYGRRVNLHFEHPSHLSGEIDSWKV